MGVVVIRIVFFLSLSAIHSDSCLTPNHEEGDCISLYSCPKLIKSLANPEKGGDAYEYVRKSRCGVTNSDPLVCCSFDNTRNCTTPKNTAGKCTSLGACPSLLKLLANQQQDSTAYVQKSTCAVTASDIIVCCPSQTTTTTPKTSTKTTNEDVYFPSRRYCGYQHSDDYSSEVKGAALTEFPWLAELLYLKSNGSIETGCQGTIINARYILTAAHCVKFPAGISFVAVTKVRLGEHYIRNATDCVYDGSFTECSDPVQEYGVEEVITHQRFSVRSQAYDIALIRLNASIQTYSDYIRPICLPTSGVKTATPGDIVITTGWGTTISESNAGVKKKILNTLITNKECMEMFGKNNGRFAVNISEEMMCTKEHSDNVEFSCVGDSGGPVMFSYKSQWHIEGVNSFGAKACGDKYPVVHTKVSKYLDWIRTSMKPW